MKIEITNGTAEILDVIPYSLVKKYTREVTKIAVALGIDGKTPDEVEKKLGADIEAEEKAKTVELGFQIEDAKEDLVKKCIVSFSGDKDIEKAIEEYKITPSDMEKLAITIMKKIEEQNKKKEDTPNTSGTLPAETSA